MYGLIVIVLQQGRKNMILFIYMIVVVCYNVDLIVTRVYMAPRATWPKYTFGLHKVGGLWPENDRIYRLKSSESKVCDKRSKLLMDVRTDSTEPPF